MSKGSYSIDFFLKNAFDERARTTTASFARPAYAA